MQYRNSVLLLALLSNFSLLSSRIVLSPLLPDVIDAFSVSKSAAGVALTGLWAAYAVLQFPSGLLSHRYGERPVILAALFLTGVGTILLAFSPSFVLMALFAVFVGAGAGLYYSVAMVLINRLFEDRSGWAMSIHGISVPLGGLLTPIVATALSVRFGWRIGVLLPAAIIFPVFLLVAHQLGPTEPEAIDGSESGIELRSLLDQLRNAHLIHTTLLAIIVYFVWQAFASFLPTFLREYWGVSPQVASLGFAAVFVLTALTLPVMGRIADAVSNNAVLAFCLVVMAAAFTLFIVGSGRLALIAAVAMLGIGTSWEGALYSRLLNQLSASKAGPTFGLLRTIILFVSSLGSAITAFLVDVSGWPLAFGCLVGLLLLGFVSVSAASLRGNASVPAP